jgi:hypothetical protein
VTARRALAALACGTALAACASPEATRTRGGGPGADPGNRSGVVLMHEGARPYHDTPRLIAPYGFDDLAAGRQADRPSTDARDPGPGTR